MTTDEIQEWVQRTDAARRDAHRILAQHESSHTSRAVLLSDLLVRLETLPPDVHDYFREAVSCLEYGFRRAGMVMAWAGFSHVIIYKMVSDHGPSLKALYAKWPTDDVAELKSAIPEKQLLDAGKKTGVFKESERREYDGWLSTRNKCAHPTLYQPPPNESLGYVDRILREVTLYI